MTERSLDPARDYPEFHRTRTNLAIHLVGVPMFVLGAAVLVVNLGLGRWGQAALSALVPALAFAAQGIGHRQEPNAPVPFAGPLDFVQRVLTEQFWRFPRFVWSGGWWAAWTGAR